MTAMPAEKRFTEAEYLELEHTAEHKNEYVDGYTVAMTGASTAHNRIIVNLVARLYPQLNDRPCQVYSSETRVKVELRARRMYAYPDVAIVYGDAGFAEDKISTLLNSTVVIEVLSSSTEAFDRGDKFANYRLLPSLREYLMISQDKLRVEQYVRNGELWTLHETRRIGDKVHLSSVDCQLAIEEIYDKVDLSDEI